MDFLIVFLDFIGSLILTSHDLACCIAVVCPLSIACAFVAVTISRGFSQYDEEHGTKVG